MGNAPKLLLTRTVPRRVSSGESRHVYDVQEIMTGETRNVHIGWRRSYAGAFQETGSEVRDIFEITK